MAKCGPGEKTSKKRAGRPRKAKKAKKPKSARGKAKHFTNGWFMLATSGGRIVGIGKQVNPENNPIVADTLERVIGKYKKCDLFVYDRNCAFAPSASKNEKLSQIKFYSVDKWHGAKHRRKCKTTRSTSSI